MPVMLHALLFLQFIKLCMVFAGWTKDKAVYRIFTKRCGFRSSHRPTGNLGDTWQVRQTLTENQNSLHVLFFKARAYELELHVVTS